MHTTSDTLLNQLRHAAGGAARARFVHLYSRLIYSWLRKAGLQDCDAADVTQDVFVLLIRELPKFEYDRARSFRGWLRTVTLNKWRDHQKRRGLPIDGAASVGDVPAADDAFAEREYRAQVVARALELLAPEFRPETWAAFQRHGVEGAPAADVARRTGRRARLKNPPPTPPCREGLCASTPRKCQRGVNV